MKKHLHKQKMEKKHGNLSVKRINCNLTEVKLATSDNDVMEFSGYGAFFGNVDAYGDMIEKGAFAAYLSEVKTDEQNWPAMLMQHGGWGMAADDMTPIGIWTDMQEDESGLKVSGRFADTAKGREAYALLKMDPRPAISGLSIGYYTREWANGGKNDPFDRVLKRLDLAEISLVTFPANDKARVSSVKSAVDMSDKEFERALRDVMGLSQKEAKTVISKGFRAIKTGVDVGNDELNQLASAIQKYT